MGLNSGEQPLHKSTYLGALLWARYVSQNSLQDGTPSRSKSHSPSSKRNQARGRPVDGDAIPVAADPPHPAHVCDSDYSGWDYLLRRSRSPRDVVNAQLQSELRR